MEDTILLWYVIQVKTGMEEQIAQLCRQVVVDGEEVFVPTLEMQRRIRGEEKLEKKPLFRGYVFFETEDVTSLYYRLKSVDGFTRILRSGDEFIPVYEQEMELFKKLFDDAHNIKMSEGYKKENRVVVTMGPLVRMENRIKKVNRSKRTALVELPLMGEIKEIMMGLRVLNC